MVCVEENFGNFPRFSTDETDGRVNMHLSSLIDCKFRYFRMENCWTTKKSSPSGILLRKESDYCKKSSEKEK